jgi:hypothetical protein
MIPDPDKDEVSRMFHQEEASGIWLLPDVVCLANGTRSIYNVHHDTG